MGRHGGLRGRCRQRCSTWWITCKCRHTAVDNCRTCAAGCRNSRRTLTVCCTKTYLVALNFIFLVSLTSMIVPVLWIRNYIAYSEAVTSHALGGLEGSRRTLLHVQQRAAGGRHDHHLESTTSSKLFDAEQSCKISSRSGLKRRSLGL